MAEFDFSNLTKSEMLQVFSEACEMNMPEEALDAAFADGAPMNDDGTINALHLIAWLLGDRFGEV